MFSQADWCFCCCCLFFVLLLVGFLEGEGDWEREEEVRGCEIVCMCVGVRVYARVAAGEGKGK